MARLEDLIDRFDVDDPAFIADPYPVLNALREAAPVFWNERTNQWVLTRFHDVYDDARDRRLGRSYTHLYTHARAWAGPSPTRAGRRSTGTSSGRCCRLEPPDHTRIRRLVSKVFTPRAVARAAAGRSSGSATSCSIACAERASSICSPTTPSPTRSR